MSSIASLSLLLMSGLFIILVALVGQTFPGPPERDPARGITNLRLVEGGGISDAEPSTTQQSVPEKKVA